MSTFREPPTEAQGEYRVTLYGEVWFIGTHGGTDDIGVRSRQDCEDLIALLERVKERLPDGK